MRKSLAEILAARGIADPVAYVEQAARDRQPVSVSPLRRTISRGEVDRRLAALKHV